MRYSENVSVQEGWTKCSVVDIT